MQKIRFILLCLILSLSLLSQENDAILCGDGIDNDGDGLIDCFDPDCENLPNNGCNICSEGISFADVLIEYISGCTQADPDPEGAVGVSDWEGNDTNSPEFVFLGQGGSLKLGFTNNLLTNSGNADADLWVFEVGSVVEASNLELRPANAFTEDQLLLVGIPDSNGDGYYEFGGIAGATSSLDIDAVIPGYAIGVLQFDAVQIIDNGNSGCDSPTPGADIDAICALSFIIPIDCEGTENGTALIDECGDCLEPTDLNFNACLDCSGTPYGDAVVDDCGNCTEPSSVNYNDCFDCAGTMNGTATIDACGECLELANPNYNECLDEKNIYIPNVFSPNNDGANEEFRIYKNNEVDFHIKTFLIYDRWGELVYNNKDVNFESNSNWWGGNLNGRKVQAGVYLYYIEIEFLSEVVLTFRGDVTLIR